MAVPYTFGNATTSIPLSQLDNNFATAITLGNTATYLGNTTTSIGNLTLTNVTISSGNSTVTKETVTTITSPAATNLTIQSAGTTAMTIDTSQNVGIGTTSPSSPLNVVSASSSLAIAINGRSSDNLGAMYFYANNGSTQYSTIIASATEFRLSSVPAAAVQTFYTNSSERMRIDSSGNVGIGTSSPAYKLDVAGAISTNNNLTFTGTANRITGDMSNATPASRVLIQTSTVNGQTATGIMPNGTGTQAQWVVYNSSDPANSSQGRILITASLLSFQNLATGTGTSLPMAFFTGGSERVRIDTGGNVGVGTTTPDASAIVDVQSTTKGVRFPNMTTAQKTAITPAAGTVVFDTTLAKLCVYSGSAWQTITSV